MDKISVITVCFNCVSSIQKTIDSVLSQDYSEVEYIIIDGGSTDGTIEVINRYRDRISRIVSERDNGIYDAMNKGLSFASGEWVTFMNAGDAFTDSSVLSRVFSRQIPSNISFLYSNAWLYNKKSRKLHITNISEGVVLHQSSIYRKSLHQRFGPYLVTKPIIISDYLFFCHVPEEEYLKIDDAVIAVFELGGVSSQRWCFNQKLCADVIFNKITMGHAVLKYLFNPIIILFPESLRSAVKHTFFKIRG